MLLAESEQSMREFEMRLALKAVGYEITSISDEPSPTLPS